MLMSQSKEQHILPLIWVSIRGHGSTLSCTIWLTLRRQPTKQMPASSKARRISFSSLLCNNRGSSGQQQIGERSAPTRESSAYPAACQWKHTPGLQVGPCITSAPSTKAGSRPR